MAISEGLAKSYAKYGEEKDKVGFKGNPWGKPSNAPSTAGFDHGVTVHMGRVETIGGKRKFKAKPPKMKPMPFKRGMTDVEKSDLERMKEDFFKRGGKVDKCLDDLREG